MQLFTILSNMHHVHTVYHEPNNVQLSMGKDDVNSQYGH